MYTLPNKSTIVFHEPFHDVTNIDLPYNYMRPKCIHYYVYFDIYVHVIKLAKHRVRSLIGFVYHFC